MSLGAVRTGTSGASSSAAGKTSNPRARSPSRKRRLMSVKPLARRKFPCKTSVGCAISNLRGAQKMRERVERREIGRQFQIKTVARLRHTAPEIEIARHVVRIVGAKKTARHVNKTQLRRLTRQRREMVARAEMIEKNSPKGKILKWRGAEKGSRTKFFFRSADAIYGWKIQCGRQQLFGFGCHAHGVLTAADPIFARRRATDDDVVFGKNGAAGLREFQRERGLAVRPARDKKIHVRGEFHCRRVQIETFVQKQQFAQNFKQMVAERARAVLRLADKNRHARRRRRALNERTQPTRVQHTHIVAQPFPTRVCSDIRTCAARKIFAAEPRARQIQIRVGLRRARLLRNVLPHQRTERVEVGARGGKDIQRPTAKMERARRLNFLLRRLLSPIQVVLKRCHVLAVSVGCANILPPSESAHHAPAATSGYSYNASAVRRRSHAERRAKLVKTGLDAGACARNAFHFWGTRAAPNKRATASNAVTARR